MAFEPTPQPSDTLPQRPFFNGQFASGPTGPGVTRRQGGSRRVGSIPARPTAGIGSEDLQQRNPQAENGRGGRIG